MKRSRYQQFLEYSKSSHQDLISDVHRIAKRSLDIKIVLEKLQETLKSEELKKSIKDLMEIDVALEDVIKQIENIE